MTFTWRCKAAANAPDRSYYEEQLKQARHLSITHRQAWSCCKTDVVGFAASGLQNR